MNQLHSYQLLRYRNLNGSTKDWAIRNNGNGTYTKRWGKTGTRLQSKDFSIKHPDEIFNEQRLKRNKGYEYIGDFHIDDDGNILPVSSDRTVHQVQQPHPTEDPLCLFWRMRIKRDAVSDIGRFHANVLSIGNAIADFLGASSWIEKFLHDLVNDQFSTSSISGKLLKEQGVASLLLFMAMMKVAPEQINIGLSHDDGVDISNNIKLESKALSFFDTDLESVRAVAEAIGLLEKRLDLSSVVSSQDDLYF